jgi:hypothetical protein
MNLTQRIVLHFDDTINILVNEQKSESDSIPRLLIIYGKSVKMIYNQIISIGFVIVNAIFWFLF